MKNPKVGERIAVYALGTRYTTKIESIDSMGMIHCLRNNTDWTYVHPKQCRRLVKKNRREFWLIYPKGSKSIAEVYRFSPNVSPMAFDVIHVREVKNK